MNPEFTRALLRKRQARITFWLCLSLSGRICVNSMAQEAAPILLGQVTNGPAVFASVRVIVTNVLSNLTAGGQPRPPLTNVVTVTNAVFEHYLPASLNHLIWTNFIAHTNDRNILIWELRSHPPNWPAN